MEERNYDFSTLSERISAQTEAAVELSNALVKIIEQTAAIRDRIHDTNDQFKDELKTLNAKLQELIIDYNKGVSENTIQHNLFSKDIETFKSRLVLFEDKIDKISSESETSFENLHNTVDELVKYSKKTIEQINENNKNSMAEFSKVTDEHKISIANVNEQLKTQNTQITKFSKDVDKIKTFFWVLSTLATIYGVLSNLNLFKITFLGH
jgi:DNA repair exonuclease SbcCD ATPase subunit